MKDKIEIISEDITNLTVDAIIIPTDTELEIEDKSYNIILTKAGDSIHDQHKLFTQVPLGEVILTKGGKLKAKNFLHMVIHTPGEPADEEWLMAGMRKALQTAKDKEMAQIALFATASGWARLPVKRCAELILAEIKKHFDTDSTIEKVFLVMGDDRALESFEEGYRQL